VIEIFLPTISFVSSILIFRLYRKASGQTLLKPNILSMPLYMLGPLILAPSVLISLNAAMFKDDITDVIFYGSFLNRITAQFLLYWLLAGIALGILIGNSTVNPKRLPRSQFVPLKASLPLKLCFNLRSSSTLLAIIIYLSICTIYYAISSASNPVLLGIGSSSTLERLVLRQDFSLLDQFNILHRALSFESLLLVSIFVNVFTKSMNSPASTLINCWGLLLPAFVCVANGSTGSIATLFLTRIYTDYAIGRSFRNFFLASFLFVTSIIIGFVIFKVDSGSELSFVLESLARRVLFDQVKGFYYSLQLFPAKLSHIGITSSPAWLSNLLFGISTHDYGIQLMTYFNPKGVLDKTAGHFTSVAITEMWANFGLPGVVFGPLWTGFLLSKIHLAFSLRPQTILSTSIYCYLSSAGLGLWSDFLRYYYPVNLLLSFVGLLSLLVLSCFFTLILVKR